MKVMLVTPVSRETYEIWMPLGVCSIGANLIQNGHEVVIFDRYRQGVDHDIDIVNQLMIAKVGDFNPDIIGLSTYSPVIYDTVDAINQLDGIFDGDIVLGGHHVTTFPELTLDRIPRVNAAFTGESEISLLMYVNGDDRDIIPGLYYRDEDTIKISSARKQRVDLSKIATPRYDLIDMEYYTRRTIHTIRPFYRRVGSLLTSRGCNNRCTFCTESLTFSGGVSYYPVESTISCIESLINDYKCDGITVFDNNFLASKEHATTILNEIIKRSLNKNVIYCLQVRACDLDDEILQLMQRAGVRKLELGLETGNEETLDNIKKNVSISTSQQAIVLCKKYNMSVQANLIMGLEGESLASLDKTLAWFRTLKIDNFKLPLLKLYPGSLLYRQKGNQAMETNEWTKEFLVDFYRCDHLSPITDEERSQWEKHNLRPIRKYYHHTGIIRRNSLPRIIEYYYKKIMGLVR